MGSVETAVTNLLADHFKKIKAVEIQKGEVPVTIDGKKYIPDDDLKGFVTSYSYEILNRLTENFDDMVNDVVSILVQPERLSGETRKGCDSLDSGITLKETREAVLTNCPPSDRS